MSADVHVCGDWAIRLKDKMRIKLRVKVFFIRQNYLANISFVRKVDKPTIKKTLRSAESLLLVNAILNDLSFWHTYHVHYLLFYPIAPISVNQVNHSYHR